MPQIYNQYMFRSLCVLQEAQLARSEAERMASLAGSHSHTSLLSLDTPMEDIPEDEKPPSILSPSNTNKDRCKKNLHYPSITIIKQPRPSLNSSVCLCVFRLIEELSKELRSKEALITELSGEKTTLTIRVEELEGQVKELSSSLLQKDKDVEVQMPFISDFTDNWHQKSSLVASVQLSFSKWALTDTFL